MTRMLKLALVFSSLGWAPAAFGQGNCSMQTIAGVSAFQVSGSLTVATGVVPGTPAWSAIYAPIALTGTLTFSPSGQVEGSYWGFIGNSSTGLNPLALRGQILELKPDCTGLVRYTTPGLVGGVAVTFTERFVVLDNGREIRSIKIATDNPQLSLAVWHSHLRRIRHSETALGSCGQQMLQGIYVARCTGLENAGPGGLPLFASSSTLRLAISHTGGYTGQFFTSVAGTSVQSPAAGLFTVKSDCTIEGTLQTPLFPGVTNVARGAIFDEGREGFFLPLVNNGPASGQVTAIKFATCDLSRADHE